MPPSPLQIATSSLQRLVREEASYYKELESQRKRLAQLEKADPSSDENLEFKIKQEKKGIEQTNEVFPSLRDRIANARERLQAQLEGSADADAAEVEKAKTTLKEAIEAQQKDPDSSNVPPA